MAGNLKPSNLRAGALLCAMLWSTCAWGQTVRHSQQKAEPDATSAVSQAETAIEKRDFESAEKLLIAAVTANPKDAIGWYDLGYVYTATQRRAQAIDAYRKSIAAKPDVYEANLKLGTLLAQDGQNAEAAKTLKDALRLMPPSTPPTKKSMNWIALGRVQEKTSPEDALASYRKAAEITPGEIEPRIQAARVLATKKDVNGAESEYKSALAIQPTSKAALTGLIDLYRENDRAADAAAALREYSKQFPDDPRAQLMLGQSLLKSGDTDGAMAAFENGLKQSPHDPGLLHEVASTYAAQKKFEPAAVHYAELVKAMPAKASYHYQYGVVLMQLHKFSEAQDELIAALKRDGKLVDAYGELAVAASENKQYPLTIRVLDARGKLAPETPATYFLRATAYDNLKALPQAAENYHKFLDASNGQFPDNEWKARHRLIAIEPSSGKKKK